MLTILALLAILGLFTATESALINVNRYRLRNLARLGNAAARRTELLLAESDRLTTTMLLCKLAVTVAIAALTGVCCWPRGSVLFSGILVTLALVIMTVDISARALGARHAERVAIAMSWPYAVLVSALRPVTWITTRLPA